MWCFNGKQHDMYRRLWWAYVHGMQPKFLGKWHCMWIVSRPWHWNTPFFSCGGHCGLCGDAGWCLAAETSYFLKAVDYSQGTDHGSDGTSFATRSLVALSWLSQFGWCPFSPNNLSDRFRISNSTSFTSTSFRFNPSSIPCFSHEFLVSPVLHWCREGQLWAILGRLRRSTTTSSSSWWEVPYIETLQFSVSTLKGAFNLQCKLDALAQLCTWAFYHSFHFSSELF